MRRARSAQGAAAEQRSAEIRAAAARLRDDAAGRIRERRDAHAQHSCLVQNLERALVSRDMKLVPPAAPEGAAPVGAGLRRNAEPAQEAERAARDGGFRQVEVNGDLAAAPQVDAAGRVEEAGELREPVALTPRS